jgi:hypothetical protein
MEGEHPMAESNGWDEYKRLVLKELEDIKAGMRRMENKVDENCRRVVGLEVKAGVWGLLGGLIPVIIVMGILLVRSGL